MLRSRRTLLALPGLLMAAGMALAQPLSAGKPMRLVVPYAAGGTSDILGRKLAQQLGERLGRPVIVENKAGAAGSIGTEAVVRADADGTTVLLHSGAIATEPALKRQLPYDVLNDLAPVTTAVVGPFAVLVSPQLPVKTIGELIAYARQNPGKLNYGTPGLGTSVHLATEQFRVAAGIDMVHVPFKGAGPALTAIIANEVQVVVDPLATARKYAESGKLRALALTTGQRSSLWPEMGTLAEAGLKDFDTGVWYGVYVPAKTPAATVQLLNTELVRILKSPEMGDWLRDQGLQAVANSPAESKAQLAREIATWKKVGAAAGIKPE